MVTAERPKLRITKTFSLEDVLQKQMAWRETRKGKRQQSIRERLDYWAAPKMLTPSDRAYVYETIADRMDNNDDVAHALQIMWAFNHMDKPGDALTLMLDEVLTGIEAGLAFPVAAKRYLPDTEIMMLSVDVAKGMPPATPYKKAAAAIRRQQELNAIAMQSAMPAISAAVMVYLMMAMVALGVIPKLEVVYPMEKWPEVSKNLAWWAEFSTSWQFPLTLMLLGALGVFMFRVRSKWTGKVRTAVENWLPPYAGYKTLRGTEWMLTLGAMMSQGTDVLTALTNMRDVAEPWLRERIDWTIAHIEDGGSLGEALYSTGFEFPSKDSVRYLLSLTGLRGQEDALLLAGERQAKLAIKKMQQKANLMGLLAKLAMMGGVIFIVYGIFTLTGQMQADLGGF